MRCPDDGHQLGANKKAPVGYHYCRHCDGLWFSSEAIKASVRAELPSSHARRPAREKAPKKRECPQCLTPLTAERVDSLFVDRCATCGGVWLDPGEYSAARRLVKRERMGREMPELRERTKPLQRLVDTIVDLIGEAYAEPGDDGEFDAGRYIQKPQHIRRNQRRKR